MDTPLLLFLILLAAGIYAAFCAGEDAYQIARNYNVSHLWQGRQRGAVLVGFALLAYASRLVSPAHWWHVLAPIPAAGMAGCFFGFLFDIWLNARRQLVWHYVGKDEYTAATDKKVRSLKVSPQAYVLGKLVGVLLLGAAAMLLSGCDVGRGAVTALAPAIPRVKPAAPLPDSLKGVPAKNGLFSWLKPGANNPSSVSTSGKTKFKNVTIQQTVVQGDGNQVGQAAPKAGPQAVGPGATAAEKYKPVEKLKTVVKTVTKTITKTTPVWVLVGLFALGFLLRHFGPWVLRMLVPGLLARPG